MNHTTHRVAPAYVCQLSPAAAWSRAHIARMFSGR